MTDTTENTITLNLTLYHPDGTTETVNEPKIPSDMAFTDLDRIEMARLAGALFVIENDFTLGLSLDVDGEAKEYNGPEALRPSADLPEIGSGDAKAWL